MSSVKDRPRKSEDEDAGLNRRGNAGLRKDLQEARRIYDPEIEKEWKLKYRNFSCDHMRRAYKVFAEARHDPFNKSPEWTNAVIKRIGRGFISQGISPEEEFAKYDATNDGFLERAEIRRLLLDVVPDLGDLEMTAVFETLDEDHSGLVSLEELTHMIWGRSKRSSRKSTGASRASRASGASQSPSTVSSARSSNGGVLAGVPVCHRSPVHRVKRFPPATVEGWDHLKKNSDFKSEEEHLKARDDQMFKRIGAELCLSPREPTQLPGTWPKYNHFGGGGDNNRFVKHQWRKDVRAADSKLPSDADPPLADPRTISIPDPGGLDLKPGYHINLARVAPHYASFSSRSTRPGG